MESKSRLSHVNSVISLYRTSYSSYSSSKPEYRGRDLVDEWVYLYSHTFINIFYFLFSLFTCYFPYLYVMVLTAVGSQRILIMRFHIMHCNISPLTSFPGPTCTTHPLLTKTLWDQLPWSPGKMPRKLPSRLASSRCGFSLCSSWLRPPSSTSFLPIWSQMNPSKESIDPFNFMLSLYGFTLSFVMHFNSRNVFWWMPLFKTLLKLWLMQYVCGL